MPKAKAPASIDLICSLCPKSPTFSDVSHLLTHISSKSHLAHRFKLQIRAQSEADAKNQLDEFDMWYQSSNLDALLSERLAAKDLKKRKKAKFSEVSSKSVKREVESRAVSERATPGPEPQGFRAPFPLMHSFSTHNNNPPASEWEEELYYATPTATRRIPNYTQHDTPRGGNLDPSLVTPWKQEDDNEYLEDDNNDKKVGEKLSDSAKLKGITWPGMALFDSATPEMKRMRNQRKHGNVLKEMQATSLTIQPDEISYHRNGEFRGSRYIFGPLSGENSPTRSEASPVKKRESRKATNPLANLNTNAPRMRPSRTKKIGNSPVKREPSMMQDRAAVYLHAAPTFNPLAMGLNRHFVPTADENEEWRSTVDAMGAKKQTLGVFRDAPEISPGRTESPLEEHRFDFTSHGLPLYSTNSTSNQTQPSPTPTSRPAPFRAFGKENHEFDMHHHHLRRALSDPQGFPPQMFHDSSINPLYNQNFARGFGFGTQLTYGDSRSPSGYVPSFIDDFKQVKTSVCPMQTQDQGASSSGKSAFGESAGQYAL